MTKKEKGERPITERQRAFCEAYLGVAQGNGTVASKMAGYKGKNDNVHHVNASNNLRNPKILEYMEKLRQDIKDAVPYSLTAERIHEMWAQIAEDPLQKTSDRLKALSDAARSNGMFITRVEVSGPDGTAIPVEISRLSDADIDARIARLEKISK